MKSIDDYKESISERYIQDFKEELNRLEKVMIYPILTKMKNILKSNKKIDVDNLEDLKDLWFWRKVLGVKISDKKLFGSLLDKTLKFLKEKQEKIIQAETEWRLDELLKLVVDWRIDVLVKNIGENDKYDENGNIVDSCDVSSETDVMDEKNNWSTYSQIQTEKKDYSNEKVSNFNSIRISSFEELPQGYKREDPKNYNEKDMKTYPVRYCMQIWSSNYIFYSNGRCACDGKMMNTKQVIDHLKDTYTLSHEDFVNYFEWECFSQRNIGNCRLLATIDSLVSFWDYEKLIRSSITKDDKGFKIKLPLWSTIMWKKTKDYIISFDDLEKKQSEINWNELILVEWKDGIKALIYAFLRHTSKDGNNLSDVDFLNLKSWNWEYVFNALVDFPWKKTYHSERKKWRFSNLFWKSDKKFSEQLRSVLETFDSKNDMLIFDVYQETEWNSDRKDQEEDSYDKLWHYSKGINHEISVEAVHNTWWELMITLSNPRDSSRTYDMWFDVLLTKCWWFTLCTKNERKWLKEVSKEYWEWSRKHAASNNMNDVDEAQGVNQIVEFTWKENEELRKARGDIIVETNKDNTNIIKVTSYNCTTQVEKKDNKIIIWTWNNVLSIPELDISDTFNNNKNEAYRLHLYWAKIANMVHFIKHNYSKNDNLCLNSKWILQKVRTWPLPNTDILKDRSQLWIEKNTTKKEFAKYLVKLWYKCEIKLS